MTDTAAADCATVELIVNTLHWFFPSFDYRFRDGSNPLQFSVGLFIEKAMFALEKVSSTQ